MQKVFITGATGFVGMYLCRKFLEEGYHVIGLRRKKSKFLLLADIVDQIEWVEGDLLDPSSLNLAIQAADYVIHSAAMISFSPETKDLMYKINVEGTQNVVDLCSNLGVKKLCFIGSTAGLGKPRKGRTIDENIDSDKAIKNTHYAESKYLAEKEVWKAIKKGLPAVIVNPPVVVGVGDWNQSSGRLVDYVWKNKKLYPSGTINVVNILDLQEVVFRLTTESFLGNRFIVSAAHLSYKTLFEEIAKRLVTKAPSVELKTIVAEIAWRLDFLRSKITGKEPFITKENAKSTSSKFIYDSSKIKQTLGVEFRSIQDTLDWICEAFLKEKEN